jgi:hypothetical protein
MKKLLICIFTAMCFAFAAQGQTLNFDEPFGTRSWTEDGHSGVGTILVGIILKAINLIQDQVMECQLQDIILN